MLLLFWRKHSGDFIGCDGALFRILDERAAYHRLQVGRSVRPSFAQRHRFIGREGQQHGRCGFACEGLLTAEHLVDDNPQCPDVRTFVDELASCLLRRHVGDGAERRADDRHLGERFGVARGHVSCQPEIKDLDLALWGDDDVRRLQISMNDSRGVRSRQSGGHLAGIGDDLGYREWSTLDPLFQRFATAVRHGDERTALPVANLVDGFDVRVIERACCLRLANQTFLRMPIAGRALGEELERHLPVKPEILGEIDGAHAARAERFENAVVGDRRSEHWMRWILLPHPL